MFGYKKQIKRLEEKIDKLQKDIEDIAKHSLALSDAMQTQVNINNQLMNMFGMIGGNVNGTH